MINLAQECLTWSTLKSLQHLKTPRGERSPIVDWCRRTTEFCCDNSEQRARSITMIAIRKLGDCWCNSESSLINARSPVPFKVRLHLRLLKARTRSRLYDLSMASVREPARMSIRTRICEFQEYLIKLFNQICIFFTMRSTNCNLKQIIGKNRKICILSHIIINNLINKYKILKINLIY